jgi:hypothetical protein
MRTKRSSGRGLRAAASIAAVALFMTACNGSAPTDGHVADRFSIVAVGDIACPTLPKPESPKPNCRYDLVADLVKSLAPDRFLALGGLQYTFGGAPDYAGRYDRYFGSLKAVTRPVPGRSDWVPDPSAYLAEFGRAAGGPGGYYSFNLGSWHFIALNSLDCLQGSGCGPGTPEYDWLSSDLATHPNNLYPCTLAYFYNPMFLWVNWWQRNGVAKGPDSRVLPLWTQLSSAGTDVVLNADAHNYERWAPQNSDGKLDPAHGMTEFVVGTGGKRSIAVGPQPRPADLAAVSDDTFGALHLELMDGQMTYAWASAAQQPAFSDSGTLTCH